MVVPPFVCFLIPGFHAAIFLTVFFCITCDRPSESITFTYLALILFCVRTTNTICRYMFSIGIHGLSVLPVSSVPNRLQNNE